jgi:hypothetical protein
MTNIIDELQTIVERGTAYGQQCEAIAHALQALGMDPPIVKSTTRSSICTGPCALLREQTA